MTAAAFQKPVQHYSLAAGADLRTKQYFAVKLDSTPDVNLCSTAGEAALGILQNEPNTGEEASVMVSGITKVSCGGTVAVNDKVTTDANGEIVKAVGGQHYIGKMLQAGVDGDVKAMLIQPGYLDVMYLDHYVSLAGITDADVLTDWTPGFAGVIEAIEFIVDVPVTTGSKTTAVHAEVGATATTGGVVTVTSAAATPLGAVIAGTAITAANTFAATDTLSLVAASTTQHAEGSGTFRLTVRAA